MSWKDGVATVVTALTTYFAYLSYQNRPLWGITNVRLQLLILLVLGLGMCAGLSSADVTKANSSPLQVVAAIAGGAAFVFIVYGLITGNKLAVALTGGAILVAWAAATLRHLLNA